MNRTAVATLLLFPLWAGAYSTGTTLGGVTTTVNAGEGNQTDPHVDGDLTAYTSAVGGSAEIRYFDFGSGQDLAIPSLGGSQDFLSDVSGPMVVFTRIDSGRQAIWAFDTQAGGPPWELAPAAVSLRRGASIGGRTVAWQDMGYGLGGVQSSEVVAYDLSSGATTRITEDAMLDRFLGVSRDGAAIVWERCATTTSPCDIWAATRSVEGWTPRAITTTPEPENLPDTNGVLVVYGSNRPGNPTGGDIYWKPLAGGTEQQLAKLGEERNPNISGDLIAFEGRNAYDWMPNWDIYLYDLSTLTLYRLTDTPGFDETLNDLSVQGTQVRVVWSVFEADQNVYGYTFSLEPGDSKKNKNRGLGHHGHHGLGHHGHHSVRLSDGVAAGLSASGVHSFQEGDEALGCSSSAGGTMLAGLLALAGLLLLGRRPVEVKVRRNRR